jgi:hypothetical protein
MEKTKYVMQAEVETASVLPKTLRPETQMVPINGAKFPTYAVYGKTDDGRRVWVATFVDGDEASAWCQASKTFGRPVTGAVIAQQETEDGEGADGGEAAQKPN